MAAAAAPAAPAATAMPAAPAMQPTVVPAAVPIIIPAQISPTLMAREPNPRRGGLLRYGFVMNHPHKDLHQSGTTRNMTPQGPMYDLLVMNDPTDPRRSIINAGVAHTWEISPDGTEFTFLLREGVKFHDGAEMTSADVKATFDRIIFPPDHVVSRRQSLFDAVTGVSAPDDHTVVFKLEGPRAPAYVLQSIASGWNVILREQTLLDHGSDLKNVPDYPGTGPFTYVSHIDDERWEVERFVDYWNPELPYLDGIQTFHICEGCAQLSASLLTGQIDWARTIDPKTWDEWRADPPQNPDGAKIKVVKFAQTAVIATWMNQGSADSVFSDARVRKAVHTVMDRDAFVEAAKEGYAMSLGFGFVPKFTEFADTEENLRMRLGNAPTAQKGPEVEQAKALLRDAGFEEGQQIRMIYPDWLYIKIYGPMVAQLFEELGFVVDQRTSDYPVWIENNQAGDWDISVGPVIYPFGDPSAFARPWYSCEGPTNFGGFCDQEIEGIIDQIDIELDSGMRKELTRKLDVLLEDRVPFAPMTWQEITDAHWDYVKGHNTGGNQGMYNAERRGTWWIDR
jgi:ABC-type transport system substrate-binding protein